MSIDRAVPYIDAEARVTGTIEYVLNMNLPGMLHGAVLRSPYPHARIVSIDASAAREVSGVFGVLTRDELLNDPDINTHFGPIIRDQPILALDRVRFVGEPVAAVAAENREIAEYAANLIMVEYEELTPVFEIEEALAPDAPLLYDPPLGRDQSRTNMPLREVTGTNTCNYFVLSHGDLAQGMSQADFIFEDVFKTPAAQHVSLEPHVTVAEFKNRAVNVWSATQTPYIIRAQIAELFNLPQSQVRVMVSTIGGGYGGKTQPKIEPLTAALARQAGRPVKLVMSRAEEFVTTTKHESIIRLRTGVKANGELVARDCELWWNGGAFADRSPSVAEAAGLVASGPYRVPHVKVFSHAVYTNRPPAGAFRGFGSAQAAWAYESQMDIIAARLKIDPVEFRRMNLLNPGETYITGEKMTDVAFHEILDAAAKAIGWNEPQPASQAPYKARGKGIAITLKGTITPSTSMATLKINADGSCTVLSSTVELGQGSSTVLAQIAADELGLHIEQVTVVHPDTDSTPYDLSTNASRSSFSMGGAVRLAAREIKQQALQMAADLLATTPDELEVRDGGVYERAKRSSGARGLTFTQIIKRVGGGTIVGNGTFRTSGTFDPETGQGIGSVHWHHAATGAEVEVDTETGVVEVLKLHTAIYTGHSLNPVNVELQTEGNAVFGLGKALLEEIVFDNGRVINASLADYKVPAFGDIPSSLTVSRHENPAPDAEVHGVGETGLPPIAPAIGNAIFNAVGVRAMSLPMTPEKILSSLKEGQEYVQAPVQPNKEEVA